MKYTNPMLKLAAAAFFFVFGYDARLPLPGRSGLFEHRRSSETPWGGALSKANSYCTIGSGLSASNSGFARVSGMVYGLKKIGDFAGTYKGAGDLFSLGEGHLTLKNQHGVKMVLNSFSQLTELQVTSAGVEIKLKTEK